MSSSLARHFNKQNISGADEVFAFDFNVNDISMKKTKKGKKTTKKKKKKKDLCIHSDSSDDIGGIAVVVEALATIEHVEPTKDLAITVEIMKLENMRPQSLSLLTSTTTTAAPIITTTSSSSSSSASHFTKTKTKGELKKLQQVKMNSKLSKDNDYDDELLESMIASVRVEEEAMVHKANLLQCNNNSSRCFRFLSSADPELNDVEMKLRKYGNGRNLSVIGPTKKKNESWMNSSKEALNSIPPVYHDNVKCDRNSSETESTCSSYVSPFSFGFNPVETAH